MSAGSRPAATACSLTCAHTAAYPSGGTNAASQPSPRRPARRYAAGVTPPIQTGIPVSGCGLNWSPEQEYSSPS
jgi:hypothetical protein